METECSTRDPLVKVVHLLLETSRVDSRYHTTSGRGFPVAAQGNTKRFPERVLTMGGDSIIFGAAAEEMW